MESCSDPPPTVISYAPLMSTVVSHTYVHTCTVNVCILLLHSFAEFLMKRILYNSYSMGGSYDTVQS